MDHWGDPWADSHDNGNTNNKPESPTKQQVATPAHATTDPPPFLNNVWDDAQWGAGDDDGGWAGEVQPVGGAGLHVGKSMGWGDDLYEKGNEHDDEFASVKQQVDEVPRENNEWDMVQQDARISSDRENVVSETSDSATTIEPDDTPTRIAAGLTDSLYPDDDISTRPSMSPSDHSRNGTATESPRTSLEEEREGGKAKATGDDDQNGEHATEESKEENTELQPAVKGEVEDESDHAEDHVKQEAKEPEPDLENVQPSPRSPSMENGEKQIQDSAEGPIEEPIEEPIKKPIEEPTEASTEASNVQSKAGSYPIDSDLMNQLFPPTKESSKKLEEAPDDPAYSSSATRKAWYRLTRKQTLREYNSGQDYDNYIRVTWKSSTIRSEVNKTVLRWASEDRMAGRGPGARASFYWDSPAPPDQKDPFRARRRSVVAASNPVRLSSKEVQPLSTAVPAAFGWSSSSAADDPWKKESTTDSRSLSSGVPPKHIAVTKLQRQVGRGGSLDLSPRPKDPISHKRTATSTEILDEAEIISSLPPVPQPPQAVPKGDANPWDGLDALDTNPPPKQIDNEDDFDDDDWGEMVESPAVSIAPASFAGSPEPPTRMNTPSTPARTPPPVKPSPPPAYFEETGSKHARPIVRLKGTVFTTSSTSKPNPLVPASFEQFPVGPSLLKSRSASAQSIPQKTATPPRTIATPEPEEVSDASSTKPPVPEEPAPHQGEDSSAFESTTTSEPTTLPSTPKIQTPPPPPSAPAPAPFDPLSLTTATTWADDADFSIFESSMPQTSLPPTTSTSTSTSTPDPTDPWSIFDIPAPAQVSHSSTLHSPTPPAAEQPLAPTPTTTTFAQRKKWEEDELVRSIVQGLPDLGYMLRR